jgi:beta-RFAP synthase
MSTTINSCVQVRAPARLHMGFLDLNGSLGRRFGSVGLTLEGIGVSLTARQARRVTVEGEQAQRAHRYAESFLAGMSLGEGVDIQVEEAIPEHIGLGSGTQLALAIGVALNKLRGLDFSLRHIATIHERGLRSGIGVGAFETGGFVVDGGRGAGESPPPVICRLEFPDEWRVLLIFDQAVRGLHGDQEVAAFQALPPFTDAVADRLCRVLLMQTAPALAEKNIDSFGRGIAELQRTVGDHFAAAQGGRYSSVRVAEVLNWLEESGAPGVGQSSWGPTGFAILASEAQARELLQQTRKRWPPSSGLAFRIVQGRNRGADVHMMSDQPQEMRQVMASSKR